MTISGRPATSRRGSAPRATVMGRSGARKENSSAFDPETGSYQSSTGNLRELLSISIVMAPTGPSARAVWAARGNAQRTAIVSSDIGFMPDLPLLWPIDVITPDADDGRSNALMPPIVRARSLAV
jgi:hypothetical protein